MAPLNDGLLWIPKTMNVYIEEPRKHLVEQLKRCVTNAVNSHGKTEEKFMTRDELLFGLLERHTIRVSIWKWL